MSSVTDLVVLFREGGRKLLGYSEEPNGCWIWRGYLNADGYGTVRIRRRGGHVMVHRFLYEEFKGPVPEDMNLDHFKCDNRACCNPDHVRPVTFRENSLRGNTFAARQLSQTHCKHGHELTPENIRPAKNEPGKRRCRICKNESARRLKAWRRKV